MLTASTLPPPFCCYIKTQTSSNKHSGLQWWRPGHSSLALVSPLGGWSPDAVEVHETNVSPGWLDHTELLVFQQLLQSELAAGKSVQRIQGNAGRGRCGGRGGGLVDEHIYEFTFRGAHVAPEFFFFFSSAKIKSELPDARRTRLVGGERGELQMITLINCRFSTFYATGFQKGSAPLARGRPVNWRALTLRNSLAQAVLPGSGDGGRRGDKWAVDLTRLLLLMLLLEPASQPHHSNLAAPQSVLHLPRKKLHESQEEATAGGRNYSGKELC